MTTRPRVSLITPTYNQAHYLAETLDSVLAQTLRSLEYRVIDDGSSDDTPAVLARYADRVDARRQPNQGQVRTLNAAWQSATGDYLAYLSSDDLLLPQALERLVAELDANPDVVCVFPNSDLIDAQSRVLRRAVCKPFVLRETLVSQECHIGPGALFRRSAFEQVGGWREDLRLAPDREFWMRLALIGEIRMLPESLALYRTHPQATSFRAATAEVSREYLRVLDDFFARPELPPALRELEPEARARAHLLMARNALWRNEWRSAWALFGDAARLHPPVDSAGERLRLLRHGMSRHLKLAYTRLLGGRA